MAGGRLMPPPVGAVAAGDGVVAPSGSTTGEAGGGRWKLPVCEDACEGAGAGVAHAAGYGAYAAGVGTRGWLAAAVAAVVPRGSVRVGSAATAATAAAVDASGAAAAVAFVVAADGVARGPSGPKPAGSGPN